MEVKILNEGFYTPYENFLSRNRAALFFYSLKYKNFLKELLAAQDHYLIAVEKDIIYGILPLFYKDGSLGRVYNSLPFYSSYGGILTEKKEAFDLLLRSYNEKACEGQVISSNLVSNPYQEQTFDGVCHQQKQEKIAQFTYLDPEGIFRKNIHPKTRSDYNRAARQNITIEINNSQLGILKEIHQENMNSIGIEPKCDLFFKLIGKYFEPGLDFNIYTARLDDRIIGVLLIFYFNRTVEYFVPAIDNAHRHLNPLSLIIITAMQDAVKKGCDLWHWGGASINGQENVFKFKKKWGTSEKLYFSYLHVNDQRLYLSSKDEIVKEYKNFYVVPFDQLKGNQK